MSIHDPFNFSVYRSNQSDAIPSKNSGRKLSHSVAVLSPVLIQACLYSLKNTSGSSPLFPLKIGITILILILSLKTHQTN